MNKILVISASALLALSAASAIASGPTLYGKIHTSVNYNDNNGSGDDKYNEMNLSSNSSRIGIKGSEDLGNGLTFGYLIEWNIDMDGGNDNKNLTTRNRAITLSGDWGTALIGKWDTPMKILGRKLDLFNASAGDTRNLSGYSTSDNRVENTVSYITPSMNGFKATAAYIFDANIGTSANSIAYSDDNSNNKGYSFNGIYDNGSVLIGIAYVNYDSDGQLVQANTEDASSWRVGGAYKIGDFRVLASYTDFTAQDFIKDNDTNLWTLGGSYDIGNNTIKAQYSDLSESDQINADGSKGKDGADMWSIGLDHHMSKRTTVYAMYASTDNDLHSKRTSWVTTSSAKGVNNEDADTFSLGIIHKF